MEGERGGELDGLRAWLGEGRRGRAGGIEKYFENKEIWRGCLVFFFKFEEQRRWEGFWEV